MYNYVYIILYNIGVDAYGKRDPKVYEKSILYRVNQGIINSV